MAETPDGQEKTEQATAKRISEARMRGQVSKSMDVTTASVMLFGGFVVFILGKPLVENLQHFMRYCLNNSATLSITQQNIQSLYGEFLLFLAKVLIPIILLIFLISLAAEISQVGLKIATKKFTEGSQFKQVFNPFIGLKRIFFSGRSFFELIKSICKILVLGSIVYWVLSDKSEDALGLIDKPFAEVATFMVEVSFELVCKVGIVYILIAISDWIYQKQRLKKDLMMTKKEVKDEMKQAEGDPKIKARLRQIMRQRLRKLMLKNVQQADVIITNPTHFAIALNYKPGKMTAPKMTAKGLDFLALHIREIATKNGVPIVEDPPLARTLYYSVEVDQEIPEDMFKAVAQVLAYVYSLKKDEGISKDRQLN